MRFYYKKNNIKRAITLRNSKGFALLYAVVVSSMLLSIALGVSNIAFKEIVFSTSAKDANDAFYAADSAAECTLFYDNSSAETNFFTGTDPVLPKFYCNNSEVLLFSKPSITVTNFNIALLGQTGKACATVTVDKTDPLLTKIVAVGYNNGGEVVDTCTPTPNSVQRVIELNY
jgi:hypothetical protein